MAHRPVIQSDLESRVSKSRRPGLLHMYKMIPPLNEVKGEIWKNISTASSVSSSPTLICATRLTLIHAGSSRSFHVLPLEPSPPGQKAFLIQQPIHMPS